MKPIAILLWGVLFCVIGAAVCGLMANEPGRAAPPASATANDAKAPADVPAAKGAASGQPAASADDLQLPPKPVHKTLTKEDPPGMQRLLPDCDLWIDKKGKRVVMDGNVCLREGTLEMFACIKRTKEHESVVAVDVEAHAVHAALLVVGAKSGTPVAFQPEYRPATGTTIDVTVIWTDTKGKVQRRRAQEWVRTVGTQKEMEHDWVFAGSRLMRDEQSGEPQYMAQIGEFICVSNFPNAMLDLPIDSSQSDGAQLFQAFTERIPPRGTRVRLVLTPRLEKEPAPPAGDGAKR